LPPAASPNRTSHPRVHVAVDCLAPSTGVTNTPDFGFLLSSGRRCGAVSRLLLSTIGSGPSSRSPRVNDCSPCEPGARQGQRKVATVLDVSTQKQGIGSERCPIHRGFIPPLMLESPRAGSTHLATESGPICSCVFASDPGSSRPLSVPSPVNAVDRLLILVQQPNEWLA
jgi:hypothetical protein